jgi:hypothetical protein
MGNDVSRSPSAKGGGAAREVKSSRVQCGVDVEGPNGLQDKNIFIEDGTGRSMHGIQH